MLKIKIKNFHLEILINKIFKLNLKNKYLKKRKFKWISINKKINKRFKNPKRNKLDIDLIIVNSIDNNLK